VDSPRSVSPCACLSFVLSTPSLPLCFRFFFLLLRPPPRSTLFPYTTLFRSHDERKFSFEFVRIIDLCDFGSGTCLFSDDSLNFRSEEHTSELQSRFDLVCRLLLEKKKI